MSVWRFAYESLKAKVTEDWLAVIVGLLLSLLLLPFLPLRW